MRTTLLPILALLLLAPNALALGGKVRLFGDAVGLDRGEEGTRLLLAVDPEGNKLLDTLRQFPGQQAFVDGTDTPSGFVVTKLTSPFRNEADMLVTPSPGHPGELVVRLGTATALDVVAKAELLAPFVGREVRLRAWFFLDEYGSLPVACAPVAVRHSPPIGASAWLLDVDGQEARGKDADGNPVTVALKDAQVGPVRGKHARVTGRFEVTVIGDMNDRWQLTDAAGRVYEVDGGEGVLPGDFSALSGQDGFDLEGTLVGDSLLVETVHSPREQVLTGSMAGKTIGGRAIVGARSSGMKDLLARSDGQTLTVKGLATKDAVFVSGVAAKLTGPIQRATQGLHAAPDSQVWIVEQWDASSMVAVDRMKGFGQVANDDLEVVHPSPTQGLAGSIRKR